MPSPCKALLFLALSLTDLLLTWYLIASSDGHVYESNPIAGWWLATFGWAGLIAFKMGVVLVFVAVLAILFALRPRAGEGVLTLGCAVLAAVVCYSGSLKVSGAAENPLSDLAVQSGQFDGELQKGMEYSADLQRLKKELSAQQCSLKEAVEQLAVTEKARDPAWLNFLRSRYGDYSDQQCLALSLMITAVASLRDSPSLAAEEAQRLAQEFQTNYGAEPPRAFWDALPLWQPEPSPEPSPERWHKRWRHGHRARKRLVT